MEKIDTRYFYTNELFSKKNEDKKAGRKSSEKIGLFSAILEKETNIEEKNEIEENQLKNELIEEREINNKEELTLLLKDIGLQGRKLKRTMDINDLNIYKNLIKKYLKKLIDFSEVVETKSLYNVRKKEKISKLHLKVIDKELLELTKYFFEEQKNIFNICQKIDKIEGIIIDLSS